MAQALATRRSRPTTASAATARVVERSVQGDHVVYLLSNGEVTLGRPLIHAEMPAGLRGVKAAVRQLIDQGMAARGPNFAGRGTCEVMLGKFPATDLVVVCKRLSLRSTSVGVFQRPDSTEPGAKAKSLKVVAALHAEIKGLKPNLVGLTT